MGRETGWVFWGCPVVLRVRRKAVGRRAENRAFDFARAAFAFRCREN